MNIKIPVSYKASFLGCSKQDKESFKQSNCLLTISVGQNAHEGERFLATIQLVNRSFASCTILVGDALQRHTLAIDSNLNEEELYLISLEAGRLWIERNYPYLQQLKIPWKLIRWNKWLDHPEYKSHYANVIDLYRIDLAYKNAFDIAINEFLSRYTKRQNLNPMVDYIATCLRFLQEECAAICLWVEEKCHFELYPGIRNQAMVATYERFVKPYFPDLLKFARFRYRSKEVI